MCERYSPGLCAARRGYPIGEISSSTNESSNKVSHRLNPGRRQLKSNVERRSPGSTPRPKALLVEKRECLIEPNVIGKSGPPNRPVRPTPNSKSAVGLKLILKPLTIGCFERVRPRENTSPMIGSCVLIQCDPVIFPTQNCVRKGPRNLRKPGNF